jgi:thiamine-phosphate pyrophosphorylase
VKPASLALYLVTDALDRYASGMEAGVVAAIEGGATIVQYRFSGYERRSAYREALRLRHITRERSVPLLINDAVDLAAAVDADGVHLGQRDLPPSAARRILGERACIGLSITEARQLEDVECSFADYLGVGPVFATGSKADAAPPLGIAGLAAIVGRTRLPCVAIGGLGVENAGMVAATGVAGIAVVSALSTAVDPRATAGVLRAAVRR